MILYRIEEHSSGFKGRKSLDDNKEIFYTLKQAFLPSIEKPHDIAGIDICHNRDAADFKHIFILVININTAAQSIQQDYDSIEIFLLDETTEEQANVIIDDIKQEKGVDDAYFKTKEEAMEDFRVRWGENAYLLNSLTENPLPNSVVVMIGDLEYGDLRRKKRYAATALSDAGIIRIRSIKPLSATRFVQIAAVR